MTVGREYLLKKPAKPSPPKLFLDRQLVPVAVNALGRIEVALEGASTRLGVRPSLLVATAAGIASVAVLRLLAGPGIGRR